MKRLKRARRDKAVGLGKFIYMEWLLPIKDYYCSIKWSEFFYEIIGPLLVSGACSYLYFRAGKVPHALNCLSDLLPTAISILIGFTVMLITLLLTSSSENINLLKRKKIDISLYNEKISLFQILHIQFSHSLFSEILLLILIFFYLFWRGLDMPATAGPFFLFLETYLTLNILLSILRGITNLYFSFYRVEDKET